MIASLPMYDWPKVREATDAFWQGLASYLPSLPAIDRRADYTAPWHSPDLLFSQTCGYPYTHEFRNRLTYVATPHYAVDGCQGADYCSLIFARKAGPLESFRGTTAAVNTPDSMSGMLALKLVFAPLAQHGRFFGKAIATGGHVASLLAVRDGKTDVCATDAICVALVRRYRPDYLEGLVEIARSPFVPGLPFVTKAGDPVMIRAAVRKAFADPTLKPARDALFISDLSVLEPSVYDRILDLERNMEQRGGLDLI